MKTELENVLPQDIEKRSFEIITEELGRGQSDSGNRTDRKALYSYKRRF